MLFIVLVVHSGRIFVNVVSAFQFTGISDSAIITFVFMVLVRDAGKCAFSEVKRFLSVNVCK